MAQRTGAERFLASAAKPTSARFALALVAVALLLGGCGGGSSDPEGTSKAATADATNTTAGSSKGSATTSPSQGEKEGKAKAGQQAAEAQTPSSAAGPTAPSSVQGQGQKHGAHIAQPSGSREQAPAPAERSEATVADISLQSPAIVAGQGSPGHLAATYTCDGKGSWPELSWQGVPAGSAELVLFVMNLQPVEEKIFFDWALAGLDPGLGGIEAGQLPKGAVTGTNGFGKKGYEICPGGAGEAYMLALYALPRSLSPQKGFDPGQLRSEILALAGNVGLLPAIYARG